MIKKCRWRTEDWLKASVKRGSSVNRHDPGHRAFTAMELFPANFVNKLARVGAI